MLSVHQFIPKTFACAGSLLMASALSTKSETMPLPRERPSVLEDHTLSPKVDSERSHCQGQLSEIAEFKSMPPITGPGECTATDVVNVNAVVLRDGHRAILSPVVTLQCSMADAVAHWIRDDVAPTLESLGMSLRGVETLESFGCRTFNGISGAKLSEHGHANALDVHSLKMANGTIIELTNATIGKPLRERLRQTACARFSTVLGDGADAYHENHVHIDLMQRTNNYKICQWDILDPNEIAALGPKNSVTAGKSVSTVTTQANGVPVPRPRPSVDTEPPHLARQSAPERGTRSPPASPEPKPEERAETVGPWTISASQKADDLNGCAMRRSTEGMDITFFHTRDSVLLLLQSQKWNLERGKSYAVRVAAGPRSVEAKALAESETVRIALTDRFLLRSLRTADALEVHGEGATLRVPLDGSTVALARLDACSDRNNRAGTETNPFVSPSNRPRHRMPRSPWWGVSFFR